MRIFWTDGSAVPNPGKGGFAVIEVTDGVGRPVVLGTEEKSTNIRMEGLAMIAAIKEARGEPCEIHSDSEFWINVLTKWAPGWKRNGWLKKPLKLKEGETEEEARKKMSPKNEIMNLDIVKELYELYAANSVKLVWVRGHVGVELNEMADEWANRAREGARI